MKKIIICLLINTIALTAISQDVVYATDLDNNRIRKVNANPNTGLTTSFSDVKTNVTSSAALGISIDGWLYYLEYGNNATGSGNGKVDIWAVKADGSNDPVKIKDDFDINGATNNNETQFVRLGITASGTAWIMAKSTASSTIFLAKFTVNQGNIVEPQSAGTVNTSDNSNSVFMNGDLAFDGLGNMYALGNNGSGSTKIYTIKAEDLAVATSSTTTNMTLRWNLVRENGSNFTGRVNGNAFSSTGSMYVSTNDGIYFIDQNTVENVTGTVQCIKVLNQSNLTDLATAYWPTRTKLPVKFIKVEFKKIK